MIGDIRFKVLENRIHTLEKQIEAIKGLVRQNNEALQSILDAIKQEKANA